MSFISRNHPQQVATRGALDDVDDRGTTAEVFDPLHARFDFTVDVAAAVHNAKLPRYFDRAQDGLAQSWAGERVWCNPPYSRELLIQFVEKAIAETANSCPLVVMLLPANRTEQAWWQELVEPRRRSGSLEVEFLSGRMRFDRPGAIISPKGDRPPFGVCLVIMRGQHA